MSAGASAAQQAQRLSELERAHARAAVEARDAAARFAAASRAEQRLATRLAPLTAHGYHLLADRKWPGSRSAQLDLVVVGPSGVWIVDSKHWSDFSLAAGNLYRGQDDVSEEVLRLADVAYDAEAAFAEIGLAPGEVRALVVMDGHQGRLGEVGPVDIVGSLDVHRHLHARGVRHPTSRVEQLLGVAMRHFPAYVGAQPEAPQPVVAEPVLDELPDDLLHDSALLSEAEVIEALAEAELAAPVEDWMTFLHPYQAKLVRRTFNGPARIRGAAGTGKTVVGLHRAAYLARTRPSGKVLFTTFVKTLPTVMGNLLRRMDPAVADRVDFVHVHGFARDVLRERGIPYRVNGHRAAQLWGRAWATLPEQHKARLSERAGTRDDDYWREEVQDVIKGRGLSTFDAYAECTRPGRAIRLNLDDRRAVWALHRSYDTLLRDAGVDDFHDLVLRAEAALRERPREGYVAVIVDEAQDLSLAAVRMLHSLVGDAPDGFTLIGDGQQSIYPGGYVLSEAGISLAGRGVVLDINYRNTAEIQRFASELIASSTYTDIDDAGGTALAEPTEVVPLEQRSGPAPSVQTFADRGEHDQALIARVRTALTVTGVTRGDIAILCDTTRQAERAVALLAGAGIPSLELLRYDGVPTDAVKVGTIKRAKGLEFKAVLLPWTPASWRSAPDDERTARALRERYVAATRARDLLWVGCVSR